MKTIIQRILTILVITAVLIYSLFNYQQGKLSLPSFIIAVAILGYALMGMVGQLINDIRNR